MIRNLAVAAFILSIAAGGLAQTPSPTKSPADSDVVKISTNLIQIDVSVTDKNGKAVSDLKPEEIEIYENGQKQKITNFSFISSTRAAPPDKPQTKDPAGIPIPPTKLDRDQIRRTIALVIDDLSLSFESAYYTRRSLKKFVDEQMQDGDLVAIVRTGAGIGALQQFTSDKRLLYAAIEKVKWNPNGTGGISAFAPIELSDDESITSGVPEEGTPAPVDAAKGLEDFRGMVFATGTLGALKFIVTGMSELPGRKSVILFSQGFRLFETDENGMQSSGNVLDFLRALVDAATRSSVVFYAVDPRGLVFTGFTAADNVTTSDPTRLNQAMSDRSRELSETQDGLRYLTEETGGFAIVNSNDLSGGVRRVLEDQSYYLIGYDPDADTFDPAKRKFNQLSVKVLRPGVKVRYRSGFFNVASREPATSPAPSRLTAAQQLESALVSPFAVNGIDLRLNALFGSDPKNAPFVRSLLHVDANDMQFAEEKDGSRKATFEVLAVSFGDNGQIVDRLGKTYTLTLRADAYKRILSEGFVYHFVFPVKKAGAYQYRVAIRDVGSGRIGSASQFIEVPDIKKKRLTASSLVLQNVTDDEWRRMTADDRAIAVSNPMNDTALRRIRRGSVVRYGFEIYNAKLDNTRQPRVSTRVRVFRDGKIILDGVGKPVELYGQTDLQHIKTGGAIAIGSTMQAGDYILQVIVTDQMAAKKQQIATQFVQFEVVD